MTALVVLTYLDHNQALAGEADATTALQEAGQLGNRCLQALQAAPKPEGSSDEQWNTTKNSFRSICLLAVGHSALQAKDYPTAQQDLKEVVAAQPTDVNSIYLLAQAYLSPKPPVVDGLFWIPRLRTLLLSWFRMRRTSTCVITAAMMASMRCWPRPRLLRRFPPDSPSRPRPRLPSRPPIC